MAKSELTKKYTTLAILFSIFSICLLLGPTAYYVALGFITSTLVIQKVALTSTIFLSLIITLICAVNKWNFKSKIWLIIICLFFCISNFLEMILVFAITQVLDELIVCPIRNHFRTKASINKEIDKRM